MEKSLEGSGKVPRIVQVMCFNGVPRQVTQPPSVTLPPQWDTQMLEFLKNSQTEGGNPPLTDAVPWDDAKTFLSAFEQVAEVCQWPKEEWVGRLLPGLRGGVEQFFCRMSPQDRQDYQKVKATLLRADNFRMELKRQHFRQCTYQELEGPRRVYSQLQELCRQWLKPEKHSKEQIVELIIQEQLLGMLPLEVRRFVQDCAPEDCVQTVALAETFLLARQQTSQPWNWQAPMPGMSTNTMMAAASGMSTNTVVSAASQLQRCAEASQKANGETNLIAKTMPPARSSDVVPPPQVQEGTGIGLMKEPVKVKEEPDFDLRPTCSEFVRDVTSVGSSSTASVLTQEGFFTPALQTIPQPVQQEPIFPPKSDHEQPIPNTPLGNIMLSGIKTEDNQDSGSDTDVSFEFPPEDSSWSDMVQNTEKNQGSSETNPPPQVPQEETSSQIQQKNGRRCPPVKKHLCSECGHACYYLSDLLKHMKKHSKELYKCSQCGKGFKAKATLTAHEKTHAAPDNSSSTNLAEDQTEGGYICCECGISKATELGLTEHMKVHTYDKHFQCEICGEVFKLKASLMKHQMLHNNVKRIVTLKGGNDPPVRQGVKTLRVVLTKLGSRTGKLHKCNECGYGFDKATQLTNHMRSHTRQRPYKCNDCGRSFRWLSSLQQHSEVICPKRHQVTQTVEKQIKEEVFLNRDIKLEDEELMDEAAAAAAIEPMSHQAGKAPFMGHLQQTPMPQQQAAPVSVAECDVTLTDEEELINLLQQGGSKLSHLPGKAKTGRHPKNMELPKTSRYDKPEKKHQCPDCDYRAYYLSELERHRKRHNYSNPYRCQTCGKTFGKKSALNNHYKKVALCQENSAKRIPVGPGDKKHTCPKCGHKTYKLSTLLVHMRTHGGENPYRCQQCGQTFSFHTDLMRHETLSHNLESSSSSRKPYFFKHMTKHIDNMKPTEVNEENLLLNNPNNTLVIQQDAPVIAMIRDRWRYEKPEQQLQDDDDDDPDPVETSEEVTVEAKEDVAEKKAAFRAILGKFAYCKTTESDQTEPSTNEAAPAEAKPSYKCLTCGQTFEMKIDLTLHENTHVLPKPVESRERQPDFSLWSKNLLKYHLGQTRPKPHPCCDCGKEFYCRDNLVIHLKTHGFENIYECGECDEVFVQQEELVRHKRCHGEQEP
ncbi:zinc finger protein 850 isoform X2 [Anolis carolinensis]|uniref:zinc finger protein 850 isoform X2 n=1 Tax=Anolis carolinensis TaxID=28377 RepID=UPI00046260DB|nr:PREDICTED: zinc finger protein 850 isoform X2 [Anolis carolinensis]|eukprot:XP_008103983.1 PREDICTED: zinc finger protein 850 isoform X2 [Anolis carolinensis]